MSEQLSLQRVNQFGFHHHSFVASVGRSGGLCLLWKDDVNIEVVSQSSNLIHAIVHDNSLLSWNLFCIYGPPVSSQRSSFWQNMTEYAQNFNGPKCFIGDFNAIVSSAEKFGGLLVLNSNIS
ncbi:hypothetical protein MKW92_011399, partial [Papaver armeniacum]